MIHFFYSNWYLFSLVMALLLVILTIIHQQLTPQIFKIEILLMLIDIINTIMTTIANNWLKPNLFV